MPLIPARPRFVCPPIGQHSQAVILVMVVAVAIFLSNADLAVTDGFGLIWVGIAYGGWWLLRALAFLFQWIWNRRLPLQSVGGLAAEVGCLALLWSLVSSDVPLKLRLAISQPWLAHQAKLDLAEWQAGHFSSKDLTMKDERRDWCGLFRLGRRRFLSLPSGGAIVLYTTVSPSFTDCGAIAYATTPIDPAFWRDVQLHPSPHYGRPLFGHWWAVKIDN
jgi:hypothetical protein